MKICHESVTTLDFPLLGRFGGSTGGLRRLEAALGACANPKCLPSRWGVCRLLACWRMPLGWKGGTNEPENPNPPKIPQVVDGWWADGDVPPEMSQKVGKTKSGINKPWKWTHFGGTSSTYKTPPTKSHYPGVGFKYLTIFYPMGEMIPIWRTYFSMGGWVVETTKLVIHSSTHLPTLQLQEEVYHLRCCRVKYSKRKSPKRANDGWRGVAGRERDVNIWRFFCSFFFVGGGFGDDGMMGWEGGKKTYMFVLRDFSDSPLKIL